MAKFYQKPRTFYNRNGKVLPGVNWTHLGYRVKEISTYAAAALAAGYLSVMTYHQLKSDDDNFSDGIRDGHGAISETIGGGIEWIDERLGFGKESVRERVQPEFNQESGPIRPGFYQVDLNFGDLNIRPTASARHGAIGEVKNGSCVEVFGNEAKRSALFVPIRVQMEPPQGNRTGYVYRSHIRYVGDERPEGCETVYDSPNAG